MEKLHHLADDQLVEMIRGSEDEREAAFRYIYLESGWRSAARGLVAAAGGSAPDAEDAIQEAAVVFDHHVRSGRWQKTGALKNYFLAICRGRWHGSQRSVRRVALTGDPLKMEAPETRQPESLLLEKEQKEIARNLLRQLDERCRAILRLYRLARPMEEIGRELDLGNANNARQHVHQCRKKLAALARGSAVLADFLSAEK